MTTFLDLAKNRRSTRKYKDEQLQPEQVELILKAALMAPTSKRSQSWEFILVEDKDTIQQLANCKVHGSAFLTRAPLAVVVCGDTDKSDVWIEDASIAAIMMQLQAEEMGLGSCWIQLRRRFNEEDMPTTESVKELLQIPPHIEPLCIISLGVKDETKKPFDEAKLPWEKVHADHFKLLERLEEL